MRPRISIRGCVPWSVRRSVGRSVRPSVGPSITRFFRFWLGQLWATLGNSGLHWTTLDNSGRIYWPTLGLVNYLMACVPSDEPSSCSPNSCTSLLEKDSGQTVPEFIKTALASLNLNMLKQSPVGVISLPFISFQNECKALIAKWLDDLWSSILLSVLP